MNKRISTYILIPINLHNPLKAILIVFLILLVSCSHDDGFFRADPQPVPDMEHCEVMLEIRIPGLLTPKTYAMSEANEQKVEQLTLLAYKDVSGQKILDSKYVLAATDIANDGNGNMTAKVNIPADKYDRLVLIANANDKLTGINTGTNITVMEKLEYLNTTDDWKTSTLIPMSAILEGSGTNNLDITNSRTFKGLVLTRMLARIDMVNQATSTFTLNKVHVYNMNRNGYILSDKSKYEASPKQANTPVTLTKITSPLTYNFASLATGSTVKTMEREIYVFEAEKPAISGIATSARIILEGRYNNQTYFYPVDFTYSTTGGGITKGDFMPVLRNHKYMFTITKVTGPGFTLASDALTSQGSFTNIDVKILVVDDDFTDVYYNGNNFLAVNTTGVKMVLGDNIYTSAVPSVNTIDVYTDAASFTVECYNGDGTLADPDWLAPNATSYTGQTKMQAFVTSANIPTSMRDEFAGYIIVKAAGLQSDKIPVYKLFCGKDGIAIPRKVGNNMYKTHRYPTAGGSSNLMQCWMVENSREGGAAYQMYNNDPTKVRGYYYAASGNTKTACPETDGWRINNVYEMRALLAHMKWGWDDLRSVWWDNDMNYAGYIIYQDSKYISSAFWDKYGTYPMYDGTGYHFAYFDKLNRNVLEQDNSEPPNEWWRYKYYLTVRCVNSIY